MRWSSWIGTEPARAMMVRLFKRGVALRPIAEQVREKFGDRCSHVTVKNVVQEVGW